MSRWTFEPGHTEVRFRARHMMVTFVDGLFKDVHGWAEWDPDDPDAASCEVTIDLGKLWTGVQARDDHLRSADFFDVAHHPTLTFRSREVRRHSDTEYDVTGEVSLRGITRTVTLRTVYVGAWDTPYWESRGEAWRDFGPVRRVGFTGTLEVDRHDWGVSWQDRVGEGGVVVSDRIALRFDVELLRDADVARAEAAVAEWKAS